MQPPLQRPQSVRDVLGRRWHKAGGAGPAAANPVLRSANFTGRFVFATNPAHQDAVRVAKQAAAQRQTLWICKLSSGMCEGIHVVADLLDIGWTIGLFRTFEGENVAERGLRAFDLGGNNRLLPNEAVEEPIGARDHRARQPKTGQGSQCGCVEFRCRAIHHQRRIGRRQRVRHECADLLSKGTDDAVLTGLANHDWEALVS